MILFGLSMDYHVLVLSRIREAVDGGMGNDDAVAHGIKSTAGVVTSAALVMVAVFGSFALASDQLAKQIGIGLAVAILIDATIVRAILLPATMKLLGARNWYLPGAPGLAAGAPARAGVGGRPGLSLAEPERDDLEALDVDEAAVGDLEGRDHRQGEERERHERAPRSSTPSSRSWAWSASRRGDDLLDGRSESRPATGSGSSPVTEPSTATTQPPPSCLQARGAGEDRGVVDPDGDDVVGVVGDGGGERAAA